MSLLDRHLEFVAALREAGLPVSVAEGLDAVRAVEAVDVGARETLRTAYAATLVKRPRHRPAFEVLFDLYFPPMIGTGGAAGDGDEAAGRRDGPAELADFRERLAEALRAGDVEALAAQAREGVDRFGLIRGRGQGEQRWSAYNVGRRVDPAGLVARLLAGLAATGDPETESGPAGRRIREAAAAFDAAVAAEVRRRAAEVQEPDHVARHAVRPSIDQLDLTLARPAELDELRREVAPLARRLATRLGRERQARSRGPLDVRRTVRASMSSGGVPLDTRHRRRRPTRTELVVLCDVSGSVAGFASFTLALVFALREQFQRVRAFTFVDDVVEVTDRFRPGADPAQVLTDLAASASHASRWGRTSYGRAFTRFAEQHLDALTPRTNLLILGDARSNHSDLALDTLARMVHESRHAWWLNPEHPRHWDTGDSAASAYSALVPMVECRNLAQLGEFVRSLA